LLQQGANRIYNAWNFGDCAIGLFRNAGIAQLVEQLICNQQVVGSNPTAGSIVNAISAPYNRPVSDPRGYVLAFPAETPFAPPDLDKSKHAAKNLSTVATRLNG
jgi:hypothetical protein